MKYIYIVFISILIFSSCSSPDTKSNSKEDLVISQITKAVKLYFETEGYKTIAGYIKLDTLEFLLLDTITEKDELEIPIRIARNEMKKFEFIAQKQLELAKKGSQLDGFRSPLMNNFYLPGSKTLDYYTDSVNQYNKIIDSIRNAKKYSDSTTLKCYSLKYLFKCIRRGLPPAVDTLPVQVTKDFKVISYREHFRVKDSIFKNKRISPTLKKSR